MGKAFNERVVKIEKAYCPSYFRDVFGRWPCVDTCDFYRVHACHDANVIHVHPYSGSSEFVFENGVLEDVVHHSLKCRWGVGESEIHDCGFEESVPCFKRCFSFVSLFDTYVVVPPSNIQFCVYVSVTKVPYKIRNEG